MRNAPPFPQEAQRLDSLKKIRMLDTPIEERFERITRMVCRLMDVPIALFNLLDETRQFYKSVQGINATNAALDGAFCPHVFHEEDMLLVPDAYKDERFFDNPFVTGQYLNIGFYAGCAVRTPDGMPVGTLCAIDTKPRQMSDEQLQALRDLAGMVESELKLAYIRHENEALESELEQANRLAMIDPLTRLWNRAGMEEMVNKEWAEARRQKKPITIAMCDIDHFKKINDTYGHPVGDEVIRNAARRLLEALRDEDCVCRVGGEEFLIILTDAAPDSVYETLDRMRASVAGHPLTDPALSWPVTMSFGAASVVPDLDTPPGALIKLADLALYKAKHNGRNRVELAG